MIVGQVLSAMFVRPLLLLTSDLPFSSSEVEHPEYAKSFLAAHCAPTD